MTLDQASSIALDAALWLVGDEDMLTNFLGASGLAPDSLRSGLQDPELQGALLDFVLMDDAWVVSCAAHCQIPPTRLAEARQALPGGDIHHWT